MNAPEIDRRVARLAQSVERLSDCVSSFDPVLLPKLGKWEADVEARNLVLLTACHARSVAVLTLSSPTFQPSAAVLARSSIDSGATALWLLHPEDPFDRETRWLAHLDGDIRARERLAREISDSGSSASRAEALEAMKRFRVAVCSSLPDGYCVPDRFPDTRSLLVDIGHPEKYLAYILLSQQVHGSHYGTGTYRKNLGSCKVLGEFITPADWTFALSICWWFTATPLLKLAERYDFEPSTVVPPELQLEFSDAQRDAKTGYLGQAPGGVLPNA